MARGILPLLRLTCLVALQCATSARAATASAPPADEKSGEPAPYEDKLIDGGQLAPEADEGTSVTYNPNGLPRTWRVEGFASRIDQGGTVRYENGMLLSARLDTLEHGAFTLDASIHSRADASVVTLWQRGLAFDNGWRANNGVGMMNTLEIELARQQYRFFLPTFPITGLATEWLHLGSLQLQASAGEPGIYDGLRVPGFSRLGGRLFTLGAQWNPNPAWQAGTQFVDANDVSGGAASLDPSARFSGKAWFGSLAWQDAKAGDRVQVNVLDSVSTVGGSAGGVSPAQAGAQVEDRHRLGLWMDTELRSGRFRHNLGAFRFEPGLSWGYAPISSDLLGAYYRLNYASQQWIWSGGVDSTGTVSGRGANAIYGTGNVRYQQSHTLGYGGGLQWRHTATDATSGFAFVDKITTLGTSRLQLDVVHAPGSEHAEQLTYDQSWPTHVGLRLSTSVSIARDNTPGVHGRRMGIAAFGGIDITNNLSIDGNLRWEVARDTTRTTGRYANLGLIWRINPRWSVLATFYDNRSEIEPIATLTSTIPTPLETIVPHDRAVFLTVRYEDHAGTQVAPLGGLPGVGAGTVDGMIFYDANNDGRRNASEKGAANVTVVLDGRYQVRTDGDGRFTFPLVASGAHFVTVIPDNLALPYAVRNDGRRDVVIHTRETSHVEIAATKED